MYNSSMYSTLGNQPSSSSSSQPTPSRFDAFSSNRDNTNNLNNALNTSKLQPVPEDSTLKNSTDSANNNLRNSNETGVSEPEPGKPLTVRQAATRIQRWIRRKLRRFRFRAMVDRSSARKKQLKRRDDLAKKIVAHEREVLKMKQMIEEPELGGAQGVVDLVKQREENAAKRIQKHIRGYNVRKQKMDLWMAVFQQKFVIKMQRKFRQKRSKQTFHEPVGLSYMKKKMMEQSDN